MKIHSWEDVIKYFRDEGEHSELWNFTTGLRGPDINSDSWKKMITCIIRGKCAEAFGIETAKSFLDLYLDNQIVDYLNKEIEFLPNHWFNHSIFALDSLAIYYNNKMNGSKISSLFYELSYALNNRSTKNEKIKIVRIVREIIEELYKEE